MRVSFKTPTLLCRVDWEGWGCAARVVASWKSYFGRSNMEWLLPVGTLRVMCVTWFKWLSKLYVLRRRWWLVGGRGEYM